MKPGFTLVELLIAITVTSIVGIAGMNTITAFQKNMVMTTVASGLLTALETQQNKSLTGTFPDSETYSDYATKGLPRFGLKTAATEYSLIYLTDTNVEINLETVALPSGFTLSPSNVIIIFNRLDPVGAPFSLMLADSHSPNMRRISMSESGVFTVETL